MDWMTALALAGLIVGLFAWLRADMGTLRTEMGKQGDGLRGEIAKQGDDLRGLIAAQGDDLRGLIAAQGDDLRGLIAAQGDDLRGLIAKQDDEIAALASEVGKLRERMARMEGLLEGLREAVAGRHAA